MQTSMVELEWEVARQQLDCFRVIAEAFNHARMIFLLMKQMEDAGITPLRREAIRRAIWCWRRYLVVGEQWKYEDYLASACAGVPLDPSDCWIPPSAILLDEDLQAIQQESFQRRKVLEDLCRKTTATIQLISEEEKRDGN